MDVGVGKLLDLKTEKINGIRNGKSVWQLAFGLTICKLKRQIDFFYVFHPS